MHQVLQVPHEQFPVRLFALLECPDLAASMAHTPPCMIDVWTQKILRLHPGFVGDEFTNSHCWRHCSGLMPVASRLGTRPSAGS